MPIKGLTDSVQAAFPRIGKLCKGGPATRSTDGKMIRMGEDLDHWRFTSDQPEVVAAFEDAYGEAPVFVNAYLPYADVDRAFQTWKEKWAAGGLVHRCDGETMTIWQDDRGQYQRTPRPCDGGCDEVGRLALLIPELVSAGFVGYVTAETHGLNDLLSIQASLMAAAESRVGNPLGLRGIQWRLSRRKEKVSTPMANGKRGRRDKWLVKLEPAADWVQLQIQQAHAETMALPAPRVTEPRVIDQDTGEIIETKDDDYQEAAASEAQPVAQPAPEPPTTADPPAANPTAAPASTKRADPNGPAMKGWQRVYKDSKEFNVEADTLAASATDQDVISATAVLRARICTQGNEALGEAAEMGLDFKPIAVSDWKTYGALVEDWRRVRNS